MEKIALVTGGSGGIGSAICADLASKDYHVIIHYNSNSASADKVLNEILSSGGKAETMQFDVTDRKAVANAFDIWKSNNPDKVISILVNNAGISKDMLLVWMEQEDWSTVIDTNLNSFFNVTSLLIKDMILNKWGRIINIVSLSGIKGLPGQTNYSAAKSGVIGATKSLAQEVGKKNITVNAIAPGYVATEMTTGLDEKQLRKLIPANRFGKASEVAALVSFIASNDAAYITGEVININGGLYT